MFWFLFLIFLVFLLYCWKNHLVIRFDTFFRKGFEKHDDDYGIYCMVGKQGDGKTYTVFDSLSEILNGQKLILNVKSAIDIEPDLSVFKGSRCWLDDYIKLTDDEKSKITLIYECDFEKIYNFLKSLSPHESEKYVIFYDELFTLIQKGKLSEEMLTFISQMRKRHLYLFTTVQEWLELNVTFRRYVRFMVECNMFNFLFFNRAFSFNKVYNAYKMKWDNLENEYVCPLLKSTFKKCSKAVADSYDTFEVIKTKGDLLKKSRSSL